MTRIPKHIHLLAGHEMKDGKWNLIQTLRLLRSEVKNRERCNRVHTIALKYSPTNQRKEKSEPSSNQHCHQKVNHQIPKHIHLLAGHEMKDGKWNLIQTLRLLRSEVKNRERCNRVHTIALKYSPTNQRKEKSEPSSKSALSSESQPSNST